MTFLLPERERGFPKNLHYRRHFIIENNKKIHQFIQYLLESWDIHNSIRV